jgi:hypothetical protein
MVTNKAPQNFQVDLTHWKKIYGIILRNSRLFFTVSSRLVIVRDTTWIFLRLLWNEWTGNCLFVIRNNVTKAKITLRAKASRNSIFSSDKHKQLVIVSLRNSAGWRNDDHQASIQRPSMRLVTNPHLPHLQLISCLNFHSAIMPRFALCAVSLSRVDNEPRPPLRNQKFHKL